MMEFPDYKYRPRKRKKKSPTPETPETETQESDNDKQVELKIAEHKRNHFTAGADITKQYFAVKSPAWQSNQDTCNDHGHIATHVSSDKENYNNVQTIQPETDYWQSQLSYQSDAHINYYSPDDGLSGCQVPISADLSVSGSGSGLDPTWLCPEQQVSFLPDNEHSFTFL